jgi:hypothetical protein
VHTHFSVHSPFHLEYYNPDRKTHVPWQIPAALAPTRLNSTTQAGNTRGLCTPKQSQHTQIRPAKPCRTTTTVSAQTSLQAVQAPTPRITPHHMLPPDRLYCHNQSQGWVKARTFPVCLPCVKRGIALRYCTAGAADAWIRQMAACSSLKGSAVAGVHTNTPRSNTSGQALRDRANTQMGPGAIKQSEIGTAHPEVRQKSAPQHRRSVDMELPASSSSSSIRANESLTQICTAAADTPTTSTGQQHFASSDKSVVCDWRLQHRPQEPRCLDWLLAADSSR